MDGLTLGLIDGLLLGDNDGEFEVGAVLGETDGDLLGDNEGEIDELVEGDGLSDGLIEDDADAEIPE